VFFQFDFDGAGPCATYRCAAHPGQLAEHFARMFDIGGQEVAGDGATGRVLDLGGRDVRRCGFDQSPYSAASPACGEGDTSA
jgi:hypothetical protein